MKTDEYLIPNQAFLRLYKEYNQYGSLVVAFDFDSTVYDFHQKGNTYNQVIKLLQDLKEIGCTIICFTANENSSFVRGYCEEHGIPLDKLNENPDFFKCDARKIYYNVLLDDRAGLLEVYTQLTLLVSLIKNKL